MQILLAVIMTFVTTIMSAFFWWKDQKKKYTTITIEEIAVIKNIIPKEHYMGTEIPFNYIIPETKVNGDRVVLIRKTKKIFGVAKEVTYHIIQNWDGDCY